MRTYVQYVHTLNFIRVPYLHTCTCDYYYIIFCYTVKPDNRTCLPEVCKSYLCVIIIVVKGVYDRLRLPLLIY